MSRYTSEFVAAGVAVFDPWTSTYTSGGGEAVLLDAIDRADVLASLSARA